MMHCSSAAMAWFIISVSFGLAVWIMPSPLRRNWRKERCVWTGRPRRSDRGLFEAFNSFKHITRQGYVNSLKV
jgi:hypothetical protein